MAESKTRSGEFALIERLTGLLSAQSPPEVLVGPGDDCAVVRRGSNLDVYTTDTLVDSVHFRRGEITWFDLGWKVIAVNLSDIAAMGAAPLHSLVTLGVPDYVAESDLGEIYRGMSAITAEFGGGVIGGDIVAASELFITVAAVGTRTDSGGEGLPVLLRSAARPGDLIAVTGEVGGSAGGLAAIRRGIGAAELIARHFRPAPRIAEGQALVDEGVRCAIDISDGLVADLGHLCDASGADAVVRSSDVPAAAGLQSTFPDEWLGFALSGGEDYELLFTANAAVVERVRSSTETPVTVIGEMVERDAAGTAGVRVLDEHGEPVALAATGWDHLRR